MTENEKYLKEARARVKDFEDEREPERLREAYMALENIILSQEPDLKERTQLRRDCLYLWLELLQILDKNVDPDFNPENVPARLIQPPTSQGVVYPPGADPALIDDPKARAEYEKAIAANREEANNYRFQIHLGRLNESIPPRAKAFISNSYISIPNDQEELKTAIDRIIKTPERKGELSKLLKPPHP